MQEAQASASIAIREADKAKEQVEEEKKKSEQIKEELKEFAPTEEDIPLPLDEPPTMS